MDHSVPLTTPGHYDAVLVGAGGAGIALLHHLACRAEVHDHRTLHVLVCDNTNRLANPTNDRTWSWWGDDAACAEPAASAQWDALRFVSPQGQGRHEADPMTTKPLGGLTYFTVRSADYYRLVAQAVDAAPNLRVTWSGPVTDVTAHSDHVDVTTDGTTVRAGYVLDSRPPRIDHAAVTMWQRFEGSVVTVAKPSFDPAAPVFMDLSVDQPRRGVAFGYVLPFSDTQALVEYTLFTADDVSRETLKQRRVDYFTTVAPDATIVSEESEYGAIPMTDALLWPGRGRVQRFGTAGGATRPATGYTFAAIHRQARMIAKQLWAINSLRVPAAYPLHHKLLDAIMLQGLRDGTLDGADFFYDLLRGLPAKTLLSFLDGTSTLDQDRAVLEAAPTSTMLRSAVNYATARVHQAVRH